MGLSSFVPAPIPPGDHERSQVARSSVLMTAAARPELAGALTEVAREARDAFDARWSGVCVIADDWQHVVASSGGMLGIYRRSTALSSYVVAFPDEPFCVLDAAADDRFTGNPFVYDGQIRFFAAAPLRRANHVLGALCVVDPRPRTGVTDEQLASLDRLANMAAARAA